MELQFKQNGQTKKQKELATHEERTWNEVCMFYLAMFMPLFLTLMKFQTNDRM